MNKTNPLLTAQELSVVLNINEFTIKELARLGELPCRYAGRRPMFDLTAIREIMDRLEGGAA